MLRLLLVFSISACSHLIQKESAVEIIPVVGSEREVRTVQNKLKKDGCNFLKTIVAAPAEGYGTQDELASEGLRKRARKVGAHIVISNLKPQNKLKQVYGLAYKCPHLEEEKEESESKE
jgi:hypothetical protein